MSSIHEAHEVSGSEPTRGPSTPLVLLLATGAGLAVAAQYYNQPMLGVLGVDLHAPERAVGWLPTLSQLGYALGLLLLAPLGDRYDRRHIILAKAAVLCAGLLLAGAAPSLGLLLVASLGVGLAATLAQDIVPAAATLAPAERRGKVVGTVMTGLLLGILLSRVVSGFVAEHFDSLPKPYRSFRAGYVFRNEKPGPGRFRQFMQFDADIVGAGSVAADAEVGSPARIAAR